MTYNTEKRAQVINLLTAHQDDALTIDEICRAVCKDGSGKSTVYRIIARLVSEGEVRKLTDPMTRHTTYQFVGGEGCHEHLHLKCAECGRLIHLDGETSHLLRDRIKMAGGFELDVGSMLFGRCEGCIYNGKEDKL